MGGTWLLLHFWFEILSPGLLGFIITKHLHLDYVPPGTNTREKIIIGGNPVHLSLGSYIDNPVGTLGEIIQNPNITHIAQFGNPINGPLGPPHPSPNFQSTIQFRYKDITLPENSLDRAIARLTTEYDHKNADVRYSKTQLNDNSSRFQIEMRCDDMARRKCRSLLASLCFDNYFWHHIRR